MPRPVTSTPMAALALMLGTLAVDVARAAPPPVVELSSGTYHVAVCSDPAPPGRARCHAHVVTDRMGVELISPTSVSLLPRGLSPASLRAAYLITGSGAPTTTIAIVDAYGYPTAEADLATYRAMFGLPPCTTANGCFGKYNQSGVQGSYPKTNAGWSRESAIDLEMAGALCPNCRLILVEANTNSIADLGAAVNTAAILGAQVISNSYGGPETGTAPYEADYDHPGVAITVSSGDKGYAAGPQFPASSPHVTAVGGTSLKTSRTAPRGWTETAWSGAGSGCSALYAKPAWQSDTGCAMRMIADVSAVADPTTGVAIFGPATGKGSVWQIFGGTSVAAPIVAGIYAVNGGGATYGGDPYAHPEALYDITAGANGTCATAYFCTAGVGYDGPTGLGSPMGAGAF